MNSKDLLYCTKCGGLIDFKFHVTLLSSPPKYKRACKDCHALRVYSESENILALVEYEDAKSS